MEDFQWRDKYELVKWTPLELRTLQKLKGNRPVKPRHALRLQRIMEDMGTFPSLVIVNEYHEVVDGQHRLAAAIAADKPLWVAVIPGAEKIMVPANINHKNWGAEEYVEHYAERGIRDYVILRDFYGRHKELGIRHCITLASNRISNASHAIEKRSGSGKSINEGTWEAGDMEMAENLACEIELVGKYYDGYKKREFVTALLKANQKAYFSIPEFVKKLKHKKLKGRSNQSEYLEDIERIWNWRRSKKQNLRY